MDKMANPSIEPKDKLRLCLLFVLKYESYDETRELKTRLIECGLGAEDASLLDLIIEYAVRCLGVWILCLLGFH